MRFFIDGAEWSFPHMDSLSREEQLEALREKVASEDRVIVDMLSDGESLDEADLMTVPDDIDVDVYTDTPWGVGLEILDEIKNSLLAVFKNLQGALDSSVPFEPSALDEAKRQMEWVREAADSFRDAYPEYTGIFPDAGELMQSVEQFEEYLSEGHYAEAQAWHEQTWKKELLPPFLENVRNFKEWLDEKNRQDLDPADTKVNSQ